MASNDNFPGQSIGVQEHLQQVLAQLEQPTQEERLLLQQVSSDEDAPPIQGVPLRHILQNLPDEGLPEGFIYAVFHRLLNTLSALHKHRVFHNNITADKILVCVLDQSIPPHLLRAEHLFIHLLIFPTAYVSPTPITPQASVPDSVAMVKLIYNLTQCHTYYTHKAENDALWAPITNPLVYSGPPFVVCMADNMKWTISYPITILDDVREIWGDDMKLLLGFTTQLSKNPSEKMRETAMRFRREQRPMWLAKLVVEASAPAEWCGSHGGVVLGYHD